ncbi:MAG: sigma-70 family RNA polymerase sigma factor [Ruminococcus sp.]|nr:sigma-70 family RNA polymerase sigma factor [Ruminococcus sp.]MDE7226037.1 sigma-70 family RNA polymerase sigma factor [Ruminococcus sp.]
MKITEKNFLQELQRRNEDALEFVVKNYGGLLKAVIHRILYDYPEDAEECLYDSVLKIWNNINSYNGQNRFENWISAIAKYSALDRLRIIKRLQPMEDIDTLPVSDESLFTGNESFDEFFAELISCLKDEDKMIFIKIFWNGESIDDVAMELGKSHNFLYKRISRGKQKIIRHNPGYFK